MSIVAIIIGLAIMAVVAYQRHLKTCPHCGHRGQHYPWDYSVCQRCGRDRPA